jgi:hypothetical protein
VGHEFVFTNTNSCRTSQPQPVKVPIDTKVPIEQQKKQGRSNDVQPASSINRSLLYRTRTTNSSTTTSLCFFLHSVPPALWVQRPTNGTPVSRLCPALQASVPRDSSSPESRFTPQPTTKHRTPRSGRKNRKPEKRKAPVGYLR